MKDRGAFPTLATEALKHRLLWFGPSGLLNKCWFFRVTLGNETYYRKTRLPHEFKLIGIIPESPRRLRQQ